MVFRLFSLKCGREAKKQLTSDRFAHLIAEEGTNLVSGLGMKPQLFSGTLFHFLVAAPLKMVFPKKGSLFCRVTEQLINPFTILAVNRVVCAIWRHEGPKEGLGRLSSQVPSQPTAVVRGWSQNLLSFSRFMRKSGSHAVHFRLQCPSAAPAMIVFFVTFNDIM